MMGEAFKVAAASGRFAWRQGAVLLLAYLATIVATVLFAEFAIDPALKEYALAVPWLAEGVAVGGILLGGARLWPALFVGPWIVWGIGFAHPVVTVTVDALGEVASVLLIVRLLHAWGFNRRFERLRDPIVLLAAAAIGRALAGVVDGAGLFIAAYLTPASLPPDYRALLTDASGVAPRLTPALVGTTVRWMLNTIAGIVLVVPVLFASRSDALESLRRRPAGFAAWALALALWVAVVLAVPSEALRMAALGAAIVLVTWAAVGFGVAVAALATLVLSLVATVGYGTQIGVIGAGSPEHDVEALWGFLGLLAATGLVLAALLAERRRELAHLTARMQTSLNLFRRHPSALLVVESTSRRIVLANDEATRRYGYSAAEFAELTIETLETPLRPPEGATPAAGAGEARLAQHRTKSGALIDVELISRPIDLEQGPAELYYALDVTDRYQLRAQLLAAADLERRRLAQELHDGLGQVLTGLNLGAQAAALRAQRGVAVDAATAEFLAKASREAVVLCRELMRGVSPLSHADGDLLEALTRLPRSLPPPADTRLEVVTEVSAPVTLSLARREHLFRIVQEAVANALKHARAGRIRVRARVTEQALDLAVEDDGVGLPEDATRGLGLSSMAMRAGAAGAELVVGARPGGGTLIRCHCPQREPSAATELPRPEPPPAAAPRPQRPHWPRLHYVIGCALVALAGLFGILISTSLARISSPEVAMMGPRLAVPSLFAGLTASALLLFGTRLWPGAFIGAALGAYALIHLAAGYALWYGFVAAVSLVLSVRALNASGFRREFDRWQDPVLLFGAAAVMASINLVLSALGTMTYLWIRPHGLGPAFDALLTDALGRTPVVTPAYLVALLRWWADGAAGIVLVVPALAAKPSLARVPRDKPLEVVVWAVALAAWLDGLFLLGDWGARTGVLAAALVLLVWAAIRFGVAWASAASLVCAMAATFSFAAQQGVLTASDVSEGISALWGFLALLVATGSALIALLAERNRILSELTALAERYRRLFESDPHPLWVEESASGRILAANAAAVRHYGYSPEEWRGLTADRLSADSTPATAQPGVALATRHRQKHGGVIDVELHCSPVDFEGREAEMCFAIDVTERNALRRGFLESTDLERRRLAEHLSQGLGAALADLEAAALHFQSAGDGANPAAIALIASASQRAALACRATAHGASPLQANNGDLVGALLELEDGLPEAPAAHIEVEVSGSARINLPLERCEHLYGLVRGAAADAALGAGARKIRISLELEPALIRVAIDDDGHTERDARTPELPAFDLMVLRATSMGARLRRAARAGGGRAIVCECPQPSAA